MFERSAARVGLSLLGCTTMLACGIGTNPALTQQDAAMPRDATLPLADADATSLPPTDIPPIDQMSYEQHAVATFALG